MAVASSNAHHWTTAHGKLLRWQKVTGWGLTLACGKVKVLRSCKMRVWKCQRDDCLTWIMMWFWAHLGSRCSACTYWSTWWIGESHPVRSSHDKVLAQLAVNVLVCFMTWAKPAREAKNKTMRTAWTMDVHFNWIQLICRSKTIVAMVLVQPYMHKPRWYMRLYVFLIWLGCTLKHCMAACICPDHTLRWLEAHNNCWQLVGLVITIVGNICSMGIVGIIQCSQWYPYHFYI